MAVPRKRILFVIMDGMGDRACPELGGKTPLQAVDTPNIDWFVSNGNSGIMDVISPGIRPGSDTAHLSLLGYNAKEVYTGRGPFEAAGIGLIGKRGDVAFRCNFGTVDEDLNILDRRAGRIRAPDTTELVRSLSGMMIKGIEVTVKEGTEHRAALLLRGPGLSSKVTDADPHEIARILDSEPLVPDAALTAEVVNEFVRLSYERMKDHPVNKKRREAGLPEANILLPRGAGSFPDIDPFPQVNGISGACVAGVGMIKGICGVCGLDVIDLPPACTGGSDTNMILKTQIALETLEDHDFVLMNFKAPDVCGHDMLYAKKMEVIRKVDEAAKYLRENMPDDLVVVFTADHSTPSTTGDHTGDPVPLTIYTGGMIRDDAEEYSEYGCAKGRLGRIRGHDLLPICMDLANRSEKFGA